MLLNIGNMLAVIALAAIPAAFIYEFLYGGNENE